MSVILSWKTNNSIHTSMRRHSRKVSLIRKNLATFINATYHHTSIPHHVTTFRGKKNHLIQVTLRWMGTKNLIIWQKFSRQKYKPYFRWAILDWPQSLPIPKIIVQISKNCVTQQNIESGSLGALWALWSLRVTMGRWETVWGSKQPPYDLSIFRWICWIC